MKPETIYLDNAATTQLDPAVLDKMLPYLRTHYGNPSSLHSLGLEGHRAVEMAREVCASLLDTRANQIVFTAGGSESNNLLIKGLPDSLKGDCVITTRLEHASVAEPSRALEKQGIKVLLVENDAVGRIDLAHLEHLLAQHECGLLCVNHGSNEVGTLQDARTIGRLLKTASPGTWFHLDAVQSIGHIPLEAKGWGVHSMAISLHKIHGPPGAGILAFYKKTGITPLIAGGGQEDGRRSGTENVPAIVGSAHALKLALKDQQVTATRMAGLRNDLAREIQARIRDIRINGAPFEGLPHILSVSFDGVMGEVLLHHLEEKGIMVSTGSACHSKWKDVSETLKALKLPKNYARSTIRFSLSRHTTGEEITRTVDLLEKSVGYLREVGLS